MYFYLFNFDIFVIIILYLKLLLKSAARDSDGKRKTNQWVLRFENQS